MDERQSTQDASFASSGNPLYGNSSSSGDVIGTPTELSLLLDARRWPEAEQRLRASIAREFPTASTIATLARVLLAQGKATDARELLDHYGTAATPVIPELLRLRAEALLELGERAAAIDAYRAAIAAAPDDGAAHLGLAVALGQDGQSRAANASARTAIGMGYDHLGSRSVLARSHYEMQQYERAEAEYRLALKHNPWHIGTLASLADLVWLRTRDVDAALAEVEHPLRQLRDARAIDLSLIKVRVLVAAGQLVEASGLLDRLIAAAPNHVSLRIAAIKTSIHRAPEDAARHAVHAVRLAPGHAGVRGLYGSTLLATGKPEPAAEVATQLLSQNPHDNHAIALQGASWRLLQDPRYLRFHDYTSLVLASPLDVPDGWSDLAHYLSDLRTELRSQHSLLAEPADQSVRGGTQVEHRLTETSLRAMRALPKAIDGPIRRYMESMRAGDTPWHQRATGHYRLHGLWSVRLKSQGHHVSHFHGQGWISSACYIEVPSVADRLGQGWLTFGETGWTAHPLLGPDYFLRPRPGMVVLFPSWMWHGTVPFDGVADEHRQSIAFDAVPLPAP